jgi:uncharacterized protein (DUF488 family)
VVKLWTVGFTKKSAEEFFETLRLSGAIRVIDVRLHNVSQLSAFAKRPDLEYFLRVICGMGYEHLPILAPTVEMLDDYRKKRISWDIYERRFLDLMRERRIEDEVDPALLEGGSLLCSEDKPHRCHRRLVAEYLAEHWNGIEIEHLG